MSLKLEMSSEGFSENVNLFSVPATDTSLDQIIYKDFNPTSQVSPDSNICFSYSGSTNLYMDLKRSSILVKAKILDDEGKAVTEQPVTLANLGLVSCFKQCDLALNQKIISTNIATNYAYKGMIDTLTKFSSGPKETVLQNSMFFKDSASANSKNVCSPDYNTGFTDRQRHTRNGQIITMVGGIMTDVCQMDRYILNGVNIDITLYQSGDSFRLLAADGKKYRLHIIDCQLRLCLVKLNTGIILAHSKQLEKRNALYPYLNSDLRVFNISKGAYQFRIDDIFNNLIPSRLIIAMVSSEAYSGAFAHSPYYFQSFNCRRINFGVDGESRPCPPIQINSNDCVQAYRTLFENVGNLSSKEGCDISQFEYMGGNFLCIFDVDSHHGDYLNMKRTGHTSLEIDFSVPTPENVSIICYGSFPSMFQIDKARNVIV